MFTLFISVDSEHDKLVSKWKNFMSMLGVNICPPTNGYDFSIRMKSSLSDNCFTYNVKVDNSYPHTHSLNKDYIYSNDIIYLCDKINMHHATDESVKYRDIIIGVYYSHSDMERKILLCECSTCKKPVIYLDYNSLCNTCTKNIVKDPSISVY